MPARSPPGSRTTDDPSPCGVAMPDGSYGVSSHEAEDEDAGAVDRENFDVFLQGVRSRVPRGKRRIWGTPSELESRALA